MNEDATAEDSVIVNDADALVVGSVKVTVTGPYVAAVAGVHPKFTTPDEFEVAVSRFA